MAQLDETLDWLRAATASAAACEAVAGAARLLPLLRARREATLLDCAALIASGRVGLRSGSGAAVARLDGDALVLESGERLQAELLVYATGYDSMHHFVRDVVGDFGPPGDWS